MSIKTDANEQGVSPLLFSERLLERRRGAPLLMKPVNRSNSIPASLCWSIMVVVVVQRFGGRGIVKLGVDF